MHNMRRSKIIYHHEDYELIILIPPWDSKAEALQSWSTQDWSGPFPTRHGAAAFFASLLPTILHKNWLHHRLYAFMTSIRISLEIIFQQISPHSNQILYKTHEQSNFWTSISYFPFFFLSSFLFFLPFSFLFSLQIFTTSFSSNPTSKALFDWILSHMCRPLYKVWRGTTNNSKGRQLLASHLPYMVKINF